MVDTGESSKSSDPNYFPRWHPYYRGSVRMNVRPEDEIGPQLRSMGIERGDIKALLLTHLHTDHAGGLPNFRGPETLISGSDYRLARGLAGRLLGYLPNRWPEWFSPELVAFRSESFGPFEQSSKVTQAGDVVIAPTLGHTPGHVSGGNDEAEEQTRSRSAPPLRGVYSFPRCFGLCWPVYLAGEELP